MEGRPREMAAGEGNLRRGASPQGDIQAAKQLMAVRPWRRNGERADVISIEHLLKY